MKVDLLRQLDEWGNHLEADIDHVDADEIMEWGGHREKLRPTKARETPTPSGDAPRLPAVAFSRLVGRFAGVAAVLLALAFVGVRFLGESVSQEFNSVGSELGGGGFSRSNDSPARARTAAPATTAPPTTAAATTAAPTTVAVPITPSPEAQLRLDELDALIGEERSPTNAFAVPGTTLPPAADGTPADLGRDVIFIGDIAIDTDDVSAVVTQARAIVQARGGYVFGQELGGEATVVSLKVPAEFFQDTVDRLTALGMVRSARVTSQDVTERIVDLQSQITTAEASVARLQELLGTAGTVSAIARLEAELLQRETNLEQLRGQLRTLEDQVALSTIVLTIREFVSSPAIALAVTVHPTDLGNSSECFADARHRVDEGGTYVVCVRIRNAGNTELGDIEISGPAEVVGDLRPVVGTPRSVLIPEERYVLWATAEADEPVLERWSVRAVPRDQDGRPMTEQTLVKEDVLRVRVDPDRPPAPEPDDDDDGLPSLRDALSAGWTVLTTVANAAAVALAFALPLLWIPLLLLISWWWRRRQD